MKCVIHMLKSTTKDLRQHPGRGYAKFLVHKACESAKKRFYGYCATGFPVGYYPDQYQRDYEFLTGKKWRVPWRVQWMRFWGVFDD